MSTKIVTKGTNRPAAAARSAKHAQRTPLPARPGQIEDAKDAIAEAAAILAEQPKPYGTMTVAELKTVAKELLVSPLPRTKGELLNAILEAEQAKARAAAKAPARAEAAAKIVEQEHAVDAALDEAFGEASPYVVERSSDDFCSHGLAKDRCDQHEDSSNGEIPATGNRSLAKALKFKAEVEKHGWTVEVTHEGDDAEAIGRRSGELETIYQHWIGGVYQYPAGTYTYAARTIVPRNASAMRKRAAMTPEECKTELERVEGNRAFRRSTPVETRKARLPFDPETARDEEIVAALLGKGVKWTNRISNRSESAVVGRDPRRVSVVPFGDERIVKFCCPVGGFRAFRVSDLLVAGRGHVRKTTPAEAGGSTLVVDVEAADA